MCAHTHIYIYTYLYIYGYDMYVCYRRTHIVLEYPRGLDVACLMEITFVCAEAAGGRLHCRLVAPNLLPRVTSQNICNVWQACLANNRRLYNQPEP